MLRSQSWWCRYSLTVCITSCYPTLPSPDLGDQGLTSLILHRVTLGLLCRSERHRWLGGTRAGNLWSPCASLASGLLTPWHSCRACKGSLSKSLWAFTWAPSALRLATATPAWVLSLRLGSVPFTLLSPAILFVPADQNLYSSDTISRVWGRRSNLSLQTMCCDYGKPNVNLKRTMELDEWGEWKRQSRQSSADGLLVDHQLCPIKKRTLYASTSSCAKYGERSYMTHTFIELGKSYDALWRVWHHVKQQPPNIRICNHHHHQLTTQSTLIGKFWLQELAKIA